MRWSSTSPPPRSSTWPARASCCRTSGGEGGGGGLGGARPTPPQGLPSCRLCALRRRKVVAPPRRRPWVFLGVPPLCARCARVHLSCQGLLRLHTHSWPRVLGKPHVTATGATAKSAKPPPWRRASWTDALRRWGWGAATVCATGARAGSGEGPRRRRAHASGPARAGGWSLTCRRYQPTHPPTHPRLDPRHRPTACGRHASG